MEEGQDRRFLDQDLLGLLIQFHPIPLVQAALCLLHQVVVGHMAPPTLLSNVIDSRPQKVVRIGIIGHPAHDQEMRYLCAQPGEDGLPLCRLPLDRDSQVCLPLGLQVLSQVSLVWPRHKFHIREALAAGIAGLTQELARPLEMARQANTGPVAGHAWRHKAPGGRKAIGSGSLYQGFSVGCQGKSPPHSNVVEGRPACIELQVCGDELREAAVFSGMHLPHAIHVKGGDIRHIQIIPGVQVETDGWLRIRQKQFDIIKVAGEVAGVLAIACQSHSLSRLPGLQFERATGDDLVRIRPCWSMQFHHVPGYREGDGIGQQMKEIPRGALQFDGQGDRVQCLHADTVWIGNLAASISFGAPDVVQQAGQGHTQSWVQHPFPGILKVPSGDRSSITPEHVLPQMKEVPFPAFQHLPALGHIGHDLQI